MKRRYFIHVATASVLFPVAGKPSFAALAGLSQQWDYVFFDERFQNARRVADSWLASAVAFAADRPIAVQGDITAVWGNGLDRVTRERPLALRGVTTESLHFCLKILLSEHADVDMQVSRLDRNLLLWTMRTNPKT